MDATDSAGGEAIPFRDPGQFLAGLDAEIVGQVVCAATDVALIVEGGVVKDVALGNPELAREGYDRSWRDRPWVETVTVESRPKIEKLLRCEPADKHRRRQVNHPVLGGLDLPVHYTTVATPEPDRVVALGRDLRAVSRLQQRLVEAHQNLERDYSRLRESEARHELLFRSVSEPILIVDGTFLVIDEANPAAADALGLRPNALAGASFEGLFAQGSRRNASKAIAEAVSIGQASAAELALEDGSDCELAASAFRHGGSTQVVVRLVTEGAREATPGRARKILGILEELPDGLVVATEELQVLAANRAFVEMARFVNEGNLVGGRLSEWLGRSPADLNVLLSSLRNHGVVRNMATVVRDRFGNEEDVEISAVAAPSPDGPVYGLSIRSVARRLRSGPRLDEQLPSSVDQLTELVGRVPLREIVRESTELIEKLCIEAALEMTHNNRASASEMLGLSRQGLYTKLRRFGIDEGRG